MQFEEFNKKIKEAAEQHHPAYDEKAWKKMERLLDKHMPQEKDRRRIIFFILLFLLLGGGIFLTISKPWQQNNPIAEKNSPAKESTAANSQTQTNKKDSKQPIDNYNTAQKDQLQSINAISNGIVANSTGQFQKSSLTRRDNNPNDLVVDNRNYKKQIDISKNKVDVIINNNDDNIKSKKDNATIADNNSDKNKLSIETNKDAATNNTQSNISKTEQNKTIDATNEEMKKNEVTVNKIGEKPSQIAKTQKNKSGSKFLNGLGFSISAGPDVSKAGSSKLGKTTVAYGAAISYSFKKFTLKTGLFSASKIYTATENNYKLNYTLPSNIKFEGADANCRVLEIPFILSYNFASSKNHSLFASAGLSSYLMNREDYKYWYSNSTSGYYYSRNFEYKNKNKHYFSVLDLSAGYTRKLSNTISVTAEPYVRIPMKGIGAGSVHLNSGGVLFSVGIQPFNNKKKK